MWAAKEEPLQLTRLVESLLSELLTQDLEGIILNRDDMMLGSHSYLVWGRDGGEVWGLTDCGKGFAADGDGRTLRRWKGEVRRMKAPRRLGFIEWPEILSYERRSRIQSSHLVAVVASFKEGNHRTQVKYRILETSLRDCRS